MFGSALLETVHSVCISTSAFFILPVLKICRLKHQIILLHFIFKIFLQSANDITEFLLFTQLLLLLLLSCYRSDDPPVAQITANGDTALKGKSQLTEEDFA